MKHWREDDSIAQCQILFRIFPSYISFHPLCSHLLFMLIFHLWEDKDVAKLFRRWRYKGHEENDWTPSPLLFFDNLYHIPILYTTPWLFSPPHISPYSTFPIPFLLLCHFPLLFLYLYLFVPGLVDCVLLSHLTLLNLISVNNGPGRLTANLISIHREKVHYSVQNAYNGICGQKRIKKRIDKLK